MAAEGEEGQVLLDYARAFVRIPQAWRGGGPIAAEIQPGALIYYFLFSIYHLPITISLCALGGLCGDTN